MQVRDVMASWLDVRQTRIWALPPLLILAWRVYQTIFQTNPQYILQMCYLANLLLGIGIIVRSPLLIGIGHGWTLFGVPFWLSYAIGTRDWETSSILFHCIGPIVGILALRHYKLPKITTGVGIGVWVVMYCVSSLTSPDLNINGVFRVFFPSLEPFFPQHWMYISTIGMIVTAFFISYPWLSNKYLFKEKVGYGNDD